MYPEAVFILLVIVFVAGVMIGYGIAVTLTKMEGHAPCFLKGEPPCQFVLVLFINI